MERSDLNAQIRFRINKIMGIRNLNVHDKDYYLFLTGIVAGLKWVLQKQMQNKIIEK